MASVRLDLRGLPPGQAPRAEELKAAARADALVVQGAVPALAGVLSSLLRAGRTAAVPVAWEPAGDGASRQLARDLGVGSGAARALPLVRDDHGGVLLHEGRLEAAEGDRLRGHRLGLQAYHDDQKVADGWIVRLTARPDWRAVDRLTVAVRRGGLRPPRRTTGRALQVACEPAVVLRDGVPYPRPVQRWTWYADDRVRWLLQP